MLSRLTTAMCLTSIASLVATGPAAASDWLAAEEVAPAAAGASEPAVAITPGGDIVVAYKGAGLNGRHKVLHRARHAFTGYDAASFFGDLRADEDKPTLATDSDGRVWFGFHGVDDNTMQLVRSSANDASSYSGVATFALSGSFSDVPDLAARPDDGALVYVEGGQVKLGRWTPVGGPDTTTIYDGSSGAGQHPRVTLDSAGNLVTAFTYDGGFGLYCQAKARRIAAGASPSATEDLGVTGIDEAPACNDNDVDLTLGPTGRVMASWYDEYDGTIVSRLAAAGAAFGPADTIATSAYNAVSNPDPVANNLPSRARALLGNSDAMLHTYLTEPPSALRIAQRFKSAVTSATIQGIEDGAGTVDVARNASDQAVGAWLGGLSCHVSGARGTVGGGFTIRQPIGACGATTSEPQVAINGNGDAVAVWTADGAVELAIYDATPPELLGVNVPASADVGQLLDMSVTSRDALSTFETEWEFADNSGAVGGSVQHTYSSPGTYDVLVHVRDLAGNTTNVARTVVVTGTALPSSSTVTTTTIPGNTTSTTLGCSAGRLTCICRAGLEVAACTGLQVPPRIPRRYGKACRAVAQLATAHTVKRLHKLERTAESNLKKARALATRAGQGKISADCARAIVGRLG